MKDNLPPLPPYAPEFKPRWPTDPGGYNEDQMKAYARAALSAAPQPQPVQEPVAEIKISGDDFDLGLTDAFAFGRLRLPDGHYQLYTSPQAQPAQPRTPDMFWNSDDADQPHDSIECFLNDQICQHDLEVGAVFTIWRAKKLPSVTIRVTAIDEEECEAEYEVIEQAHGITKGTT